MTTSTKNKIKTKMVKKSVTPKRDVSDSGSNILLFAIVAVASIIIISASLLLFEASNQTDNKQIFKGYEQRGKTIQITQNLRAHVSEGNIAKDNVPKSLEVSHILQNPPQRSKFAYVTLISGIDRNFRYRGFLYNTLIMRQALVNAGSDADFIALIGYANSSDTLPFEDDMNILKLHNIIVYPLPRYLDLSEPFIFAEMALLKVIPWSFTQYDRIQFFDGDVMPTRNMDCFFKLDSNTFTIGAVSPLNSGWYLAIPNMERFEEMKAKAIWRLHCDWDEKLGWGIPMDKVNLFVRGGKPIKVWQFNGCDMDQGLLTHTFVVSHGNAILIDTDLKTARKFDKGLIDGPDIKLSMSDALSCCNGEIPTSFFAHFTGRSKPWMILDGTEKSKQGFNMKRWIKHLDSLNMPINSSNIHTLNLGSPLGFWNVNFPKKNNICKIK
jgi:hypothetical protein